MENKMYRIIGSCSCNSCKLYQLDLCVGIKDEFLIPIQEAIAEKKTDEQIFEEIPEALLCKDISANYDYVENLYDSADNLISIKNWIHDAYKNESGIVCLDASKIKDKLERIIKLTLAVAKEMHNVVA